MSAPLLRLSTFAPLIGEVFSIEPPGGPALDLRLVRVTPVSKPRLPGPDGITGDAFSLYFLGPETQPIPQATYPFAHPAIGRQDIFVVPVGRESGGLVYEAVFN